MSGEIVAAVIESAPGFIALAVALFVKRDTARIHSTTTDTGEKVHELANGQLDAKIRAAVRQVVAERAGQVNQATVAAALEEILRDR